MNMLEKAIVSVRGTDITPVLRCEVDMGFGKELEGSVPADYMTCDEEEVRWKTLAFPRRVVCSLLPWCEYYLLKQTLSTRSVLS